MNEQKNALVEIEKALQLAPENVEVLSNSILVYELAGRRDKALQALEELIKRGGPREDIQRDPFLSELRKDERYQQFIKK